MGDYVDVLSSVVRSATATGSLHGKAVALDFASSGLSGRQMTDQDGKIIFAATAARAGSPATATDYKKGGLGAGR